MYPPTPQTNRSRWSSFEFFHYIIVLWSNPASPSRRPRVVTRCFFPIVISRCSLVVFQVTVSRARIRPVSICSIRTTVTISRCRRKRLRRTPRPTRFWPTTTRTVSACRSPKSTQVRCARKVPRAQITCKLYINIHSVANSVTIVSENVLKRVNICTTRMRCLVYSTYSFNNLFSTVESVLWSIVPPCVEPGSRLLKQKKVRLHYNLCCRGYDLETLDEKNATHDAI